MSYLGDLNNPKWIKKRNQILKRDKYTCTVCGSKQNLQVHHTFYYKHLVAPWEYPNNSLLTICHDCHNNYHKTHELTIKDNPKFYYKKPWNKPLKDKGIRYPRNLSLAGKVEFRKRWLKKKNSSRKN